MNNLKENPMNHHWLYNSITALYLRLIKWSSNLQSLFLFWMRLTWGPQFIVMGLTKLRNPEEATLLLTTTGAYIEVICGSLLLVGLASRLAAIPLVFTTLELFNKVPPTTFSEWKFFTHPSLIAHQPLYPFFITALLVLIFGPGRISIDAWIKRQLHKKNHHA